MFNVGGGEFLVIALIALIVLGPQRLPKAAREVGKAMSELRRLSSGFQNDVRDALADADAAPASQPRRDPLTAADDPSERVDAAVRSVSDGPARRRTPLRAQPRGASSLSKGQPAPGKGA